MRSQFTAQINFVLYNIMYFRKLEFENEILSKQGGGRKIGEVSFQRSDCET